ncbi:MAG: arginyltransferase [Spirochaetota bacterium]|nr:arginyltransferase [Spirochaetota bacterium]
MIIQGAPLGTYRTECPYIPGNSFTSENIIVKEIDYEGLDHLLSLGFRHFGEHFFRPICPDCHQCIPIRVPVDGFAPSRSLKRVWSRGRKLEFRIGEPVPSREKHQLYLSHTERFEQKDSTGYDGFAESFFHRFPFSRELQIFDGGRLIAVSHFDMTAGSLSAVYCYWDRSAAGWSPGTLAVLKEIETARAHRLLYVYLGYYVPENRHMNYKARFRPSEVLLTEGSWVPFRGPDDNGPAPEIEELEFRPRSRLVRE